MVENNIQTAPCKRLRAVVRAAALHCPMPVSRYDPGDVFDLEITGVYPAVTGRARLEVERFVGGGFAGQVYKTRLTDLHIDGAVPGLEVGYVYAVKILVPPTRFSRLFRNAVYWAGYQGPFAPQVNPHAARTGVLWQKLIR